MSRRSSAIEWRCQSRRIRRWVAASAGQPSRSRTLATTRILPASQEEDPPGDRRVRRPNGSQQLAALGRESGSKCFAGLVQRATIPGGVVDQEDDPVDPGVALLEADWTVEHLEVAQSRLCNNGDLAIRK